MSKGLLIVERIVLESLANNEKNVSELEFDTNLSSHLLGNIVSTLVLRGILNFKRGKYFINRENMSWIKEINSHDSVKEEVKELFISLVNQYYDHDKKKETGLKVQKVYMDQSEELIFNSLLYNLESFVKGLRANKKNSGKTCEQKVVMWGHSTYGSILDSMIGMG